MIEALFRNRFILRCSKINLSSIERIMMHSPKYFALALAATAAAPAFAQDTAPPDEITVSGDVALVSDYRFRGVSQTDKEIAIQGGASIAHSSGVYGGFWASNLAGWGTFGGSNTELDLYAGYVLPISGGDIDVGGTWFMYPGGSDTTDFVEFYAKLNGTIGPAALTAGVAYAPAQEALGNVFFTGAASAAGIANDPGDKEDNLYLFGDGSVGVPNTPITFNAHIGYSDGNPGLGPNGTSIAPTGSYWDWSLGAEAVYKALTFGVAYVDTDISRSESAYLLPNFQETSGGRIDDASVVFSVSAGF